MTPSSPQKFNHWFWRFTMAFWSPIIAWCCRNFSLKFMYFLRIIFTFIVYVLHRPYRHLVIANVRQVMGENISQREAVRMGWRIFRNYCRYLLDMYYYGAREHRQVAECLETFRGYEHLQKCLAEGKGAILLTAHIGNWEMGAFLLSLLEHPVNILYFQDQEPRMERIRSRIRTAANVKELNIGGSAFSTIEVLRALRNNELVGIQGDRLYGDVGVEVNFFGKPALFPRGAVMIALLAGCPIIPSFILQGSAAKYHFILEEPLYMEKTGNRQHDLKVNLDKVVKVLEKYILNYLDQWYCFASIWKENQGQETVDSIQ